MGARAALPGRGSLRVQAWIYTALNPIIEACRREHELLAAGDLSWRHAGADLAHLHHVEDWLSWGGRQNLGDLLPFAAGFAPLVESRDEVRDALLRAAAETQRTLVGERGFRAAIHGARHLARGMPEADLIACVAERVVNGGAGDAAAPDHEVWHSAHPALLPFLEAALVVLTPTVAALDRATVGLGRACVDLRRRLCEEFDLPPAPAY
jgi:hypothetical protein